MQDLYDKLEAKRVELEDKYTTRAALRFLNDNYTELSTQQLDEMLREEEEETEENPEDEYQSSTKGSSWFYDDARAGFSTLQPKGIYLFL